MESDRDAYRMPFVCDVCWRWCACGELSNHSTGERLVCIDCALREVADESLKGAPDAQ